MLDLAIQILACFVYVFVFFALYNYRVCLFPRSTHDISSPAKRLNMFSTIILDCQTKTATPCPHYCIAYKICSAKKLR
jgi:hypothetical protein